MAQGLVSLLLGHDGLTLVSFGELVVAASDEQVRVGEPAKCHKHFGCDYYVLLTMVTAASSGAS